MHWSTTAEKREKVGMKMPSTKLLIFGSPKASTPLRPAALSSAIDLLFKILIWEDGHGSFSANDEEKTMNRREFVGCRRCVYGNNTICWADSDRSCL